MSLFTRRVGDGPTTAAELVERLDKAAQADTPVMFAADECISLLKLVRRMRAAEISQQTASILERAGLPPGAVRLEAIAPDKEVERVRTLLDNAHGAHPIVKIPDVRYLIEAHDDVVTQNSLLRSQVKVLELELENADRPPGPLASVEHREIDPRGSSAREVAGGRLDPAPFRTHLEPELDCS